MLRTRIAQPTLAGLWRVLHALLETAGAEDASAQARALAVAGLTGRSAERLGVRVERRGNEVHITAHTELEGHDRPDRRQPCRSRRKGCSTDQLLTCV